MATRLPMLTIQMKKTAVCEWKEGLTKYIEQVHEEDPNNYADEMTSLEQLRQDIRGVGKDQQGRDLLYKYFGQLELLERRIPIGDGEKQACIHFTWNEAYGSPDPVTQCTTAFEKACIIFNLGSILSHMAATANRSEEEGLKFAFNYFQTSAGVFQYINDNFLHSPSTDMHREAVAMYVQLMLTQAQECFVEKAIGEKRKSSIILKLASQAAHGYAACAEALTKDPLTKYFPGYFGPFLQLKAKYFSSLSNYHRSIQAEADAKYGQQVAYAQMAEELAKEALKLAKEVQGYKQTDELIVGAAAKSANAKPSGVCMDVMKDHAALMTEKKNSAVKDNDIVYHDTVPSLASLEPAEKLSMVKTMRLSELVPNISHVIGEDIFKRLVPMAVHEKASVYSEEKSKLLRQETGRVDEADADLSAKLASLGLPQALDKLKQTAKGVPVQIDLPKEVLEWAETVRQSEQHDTVDTLLQTADGLHNDAVALLDALTSRLDQEQAQFTTNKTKFDQKWTQLPSTEAAVGLRQQIQMQRENLNRGEAGDRTLRANWNANRQDAQVLLGSNQALETFYTHELKRLQSGPKQDELSLLDAPVSTLEQGTKEKEWIAKVDGLLQTLTLLKKDRQSELTKLKEKIQKDDIQDSLVHSRGQDASVFRTELEKFSEHRARLTQMIQQQVSLLEDVTSTYGLLSESSLAQQTMQASAHRNQINQRLKSAFQSYQEIRKNAVRGIEYYAELKDLVDQIRPSVDQYIKRREEESERMAKEVVSNTTQALQDRLSQMNVRPTGLPSPSPLGSNPYPAAPTGGYFTHAPPAAAGQAPPPSYGYPPPANYAYGYPPPASVPHPGAAPHLTYAYPPPANGSQPGYPYPPAQGGAPPPGSNPYYYGYPRPPPQ